MPIRFIHTADFHLGYQQYGSNERFNDFGRVFLYIVEQAVERDVDFVLLAGDLFHKRKVEPLAMHVAIEGLRRLREADIPIVAVEGNHERAYYGDRYSWVEFLDAMGYLRLLNPRFEDGRAVLEPYGDAGGAYVDLAGGVRVYGVKYYGASTRKVFDLIAGALQETGHRDAAFTILMAHAGVEGQVPHCSGTLTYNDLAPLRDRVDYLALGHVHKPYTLDGWIYNPGSPETCGMDEVGWPQRGYYLVEVEPLSSRATMGPGGNRGHRAELIVPPRRRFRRLRLEVDALTDPNAVYERVRTLLRRGYDDVARDPAPVVELTLSGVLQFNRFDLDLSHVKDLIEDAWSPVVARVRNTTTPAEFEVRADTEATRPELERRIIQELLERDARFRPGAEDWTGVALDVKELVLEGSPPEEVIDTLRRARAELSIPAEEA